MRFRVFLVILLYFRTFCDDYNICVFGVEWNNMITKCDKLEIDQLKFKIISILKKIYI